MKVNIVIVLIIGWIETVLLKCPLKSKIHASIQKQLSPFQEGITEEMLNYDIVSQSVGSLI